MFHIRKLYTTREQKYLGLNIPEPIALGQFINGLSQELRAEVRLMGPRSLEHAMELVVKVEEKQQCSLTHKTNTAHRNPTPHYQNQMGRTHYTYLSPAPNPTNLTPMFKPLTSQIQPAQSKLSSNTITQPTQTKTHTFPNTRPNTGIRRLTDQEFQHQRANGLCFRCDGKWDANHKSQNKEMSMMIAGSEGDGSEREAEEGGGEDGAQVNMAEVSLCSVVGLTTPKTMKMQGEIKGTQVVVMVDPGATHNFISTTAVEKLGIPVTGEEEFGVALGNGARVRGKGCCRAVTLVIQGVSIEEDFLPLELGNSDLILGIQWLEKLGEVTTNWKHQSMSFMWGGQGVKLRGDPSLGRTQVSLKG